MRRPQLDIQLKTPEQIELMRGAGLVVAAALDAMRDAVAPGVSTGDLDAIAEKVIRDAGADPVVQGLPRLPGVDLRLGQRAGRARHPAAPSRCWPRATCSRWTAARS